MTLTCFPRRARRFVAFVCLLFLVAVSFPVSPSEVRAFPPTKLLGLVSMGVSHADITEIAFSDFVKSHFNVTALDSRMKSAQKTITEANAAVDEDQFNSEKHFDGESFPEGQQRLNYLSDYVIASMGRWTSSRDYSQVIAARKALGSALHTLQDFYSHTNWVELGNRDLHPQLGRGSAITRLPEETPTCRDCPPANSETFPCPHCSGGQDLVTNGLTSGYNSGQYRIKPSGKCSHGGPFDSSTSSRSDGINKDSGNCAVSRHYYLHIEAAALALRATVKFFQETASFLTSEQSMVLFGAGTTESLGFLVETSAKMQFHMLKVINTIQSMAEKRSATLGGRYVIGTFDRFEHDSQGASDLIAFKVLVGASLLRVPPITITGDCTQLLTWQNINGMTASMAGGGDLYVFTNATPLDEDAITSVTYNAQRRGVRINFIDPGTCVPSASSGSAAPTVAAPVSPSLLRVATDTGGRVFALDPSRTDDVEPLSNLTANTDSSNVLLAHSLPGGLSHTYKVPVDSTLTRLTFAISRGTALLRRPDGIPILLLPDFFVPQRDGAVYSVDNPIPGDWAINTFDDGNFSLKVSGESALDLSSFTFVRPGGRPGHEGLFPITGMPIVGEPSTVSADILGSITSPQFELRDENGSLLQTLSLSPVDGQNDRFLGNFTSPTTPFRVYLTGRDASGFNVQRALSGTIRPQTVKIDAPVSQDLQRGKISTYTFKVTNRGATGPFTVTATDDMGYIVSNYTNAFTLKTNTFSLKTNQSRNVTITLKPPADTEPGTLDALTLNVAGASADANNFSTVTSLVVNANDPPDVSGTRLSVGEFWPPNHKLIDATILGVTDPEGSPVRIQIESITSDEATSGIGDICPDAYGVGTASAKLRAERDGTGNGRVYTVTFIATDNLGASSRGSVKGCVPHSIRGRCIDDGVAYNAFSCDAASSPKKLKSAVEVRAKAP